MRELIENRLQSLAAEYKAGDEMLMALDAQRANLQMTLARVSGAIQILQELLQSRQTPVQGLESDSIPKLSALG